ncbi:MAG: ATP-binding protein [Acidimicrobiales bacterium]
MRSAEIMLPPHPASVGRARRWLSHQLDEWGLDDLDYDASVVLSELVTNAILHARTEIELKATHADVLRLEVCDSSATLPIPRGHAATTTTGRGLHLVAALASSWGYEPHGGGKTVWAEFADVNPARSPHPPASAQGTNIRVLERPGYTRCNGPHLTCLGKIA